MSLTLKTPAVTFGSFIKTSVPPITGDLTTALHLGGSAAASIPNLGSGSDATAGASVTFQPAYMEARDGNTNALFAMQTTDLDNASDDLTFCALVKRADAAFRQFIGTYNGVTSGAGLTAFGMTVGTGSAVTSASFPLAPTAQWVFHAGLVYDNTLLAITGYDGRLLLGNPVAATRVKSANGARIGGALATSSTAVVDIASVSKHTRALAEREVLDIYRYMRVRAEDLGLSVL